MHFIDESAAIGSSIENVAEENPVEFQEEFEESDQENDLESGLKNDETTEEAPIYYEEQHEDEQHEYGYAPEDAMTSDTEEFDNNQLYTEEVEDEMESAIEDEFHIKTTGDEDEEYTFDEVIMMEEASLVTKPKRKYERQTQNADKSFKCWMTNCGAAFSNRQTMKKHMLHSHSVVVNKSTCMICGAKFDKYPEYLAHVKGHTRKFECEVCKSTFVSIAVLAGHMKRAHPDKDDEQRTFACLVSKASISVESTDSNLFFRFATQSSSGKSTSTLM